MGLGDCDIKIHRSSDGWLSGSVSEYMLCVFICRLRFLGSSHYLVPTRLGLFAFSSYKSTWNLVAGSFFFVPAWLQFPPLFKKQIPKLTSYQSDKYTHDDSPQHRGWSKRFRHFWIFLRSSYILASLPNPLRRHPKTSSRWCPIVYMYHIVVVVVLLLVLLLFLPLFLTLTVSHWRRRHRTYMQRCYVDQVL